MYYWRIWLTEAMCDDTASGGTCAGFTMGWHENKSDQSLHWSSTSIGVARKGLKAMCVQEQVMPRDLWKKDSAVIAWMVVRCCCESPISWKLLGTGYSHLYCSVVLKSISSSLKNCVTREKFNFLAEGRNANIHSGQSQVFPHGRGDMLLSQRLMNQPEWMLFKIWFQ